MTTHSSNSAPARDPARAPDRSSARSGSSAWTRKIAAAAILIIAAGLLIWFYTSRASGNSADRAAEARSAELLREAAALEQPSATPTDPAPAPAPDAGAPAGAGTTRQPVRGR